MKRTKLGLELIADWHNLSAAFGRAAIGAGNNPAVEIYRANLDYNLSRLREEILSETLTLGHMTSFCIRDPKVRIIHAPCFADRVLHHAIIAHVGPVLDKALIDDTFACRKGKGGLAAVLRCQQHLRRYNYFVQIDIKNFFASLDQGILIQTLQRKFKSPALLRLLEKIIRAHQVQYSKGLPIGALTSQHFANYYLAELDRFLLEQCKVRGMVRYMDDVLWCCDTKQRAVASLRQAKLFVEEQLNLSLKPARIGRCVQGTLFCGYRVLPGCLLLSRRRKKRYIERRRCWERRFEQGKIDARQLQTGYSAVLGFTCHADARTWRLEQLQRNPLSKILQQV